MPFVRDGVAQAPTMPDLVLFQGQVHDYAHAVVIFELKAAENSWPADTSDAIVQALSYGENALRSQPTRPWIYVVVTNASSFFRLIRVRRVDLTTHIDRIRYGYVASHPYDERAVSWIAWLLTRTAEELGCVSFHVTINSVRHQLSNYIGHGQYSYAFELAMPSGQSVVVKYFPSVAMADHERAIYTAIGQCDSTTQRVAGMQPTEPHFIVITPRGYSFSSACRPVTTHHIDQLFAALQHLHTQGVVHRDICASKKVTVSVLY